MIDWSWIDLYNFCIGMKALRIPKEINVTLGIIGSLSRNIRALGLPKRVIP